MGTTMIGTHTTTTSTATTTTPTSEKLLNVSVEVLKGLHSSDDLTGAWAVFSKCKSKLNNGDRLENITWRLWHQEMAAASSTANVSVQPYQPLTPGSDEADADSYLTTHVSPTPRRRRRPLGKIIHDISIPYPATTFSPSSSVSVVSAHANANGIQQRPRLPSPSNSSQSASTEPPPIISAPPDLQPRTPTTRITTVCPSPRLSPEQSLSGFPTVVLVTPTPNLTPHPTPPTTPTISPQDTRQTPTSSPQRQPMLGPSSSLLPVLPFPLPGLAIADSLGRKDRLAVPASGEKPPIIASTRSSVVPAPTKTASVSLKPKFYMARGGARSGSAKSSSSDDTGSSMSRSASLSAGGSGQSMSPVRKGMKDEDDHDEDAEEDAEETAGKASSGGKRSKGARSRSRGRAAGKAVALAAKGKRKAASLARPPVASSSVKPGPASGSTRKDDPTHNADRAKLGRPSPPDSQRGLQRTASSSALEKSMGPVRPSVVPPPMAKAPTAPPPSTGAAPRPPLMRAMTTGSHVGSGSSNSHSSNSSQQRPPNRLSTMAQAQFHMTALGPPRATPPVNQPVALPRQESRMASVGSASTVSTESDTDAGSSWEDEDDDDDEHYEDDEVIIRKDSKGKVEAIVAVPTKGKGRAMSSVALNGNGNAARSRSRARSSDRRAAQAEEQRLLAAAAAEVKRTREMFQKKPAESYVGLPRNRSSGLLSQLMNPDPDIFPPEHPYRRKYNSSGNLAQAVRVGVAAQPMRDSQWEAEIKAQREAQMNRARQVDAARQREQEAVDRARQEEIVRGLEKVQMQEKEVLGQMRQRQQQQQQQQQQQSSRVQQVKTHLRSSSTGTNTPQGSLLTGRRLPNLMQPKSVAQVSVSKPNVGAAFPEEQGPATALPHAGRRLGSPGMRRTQTDNGGVIRQQQAALRANAEMEEETSGDEDGAGPSGSGSGLNMSQSVAQQKLAELISNRPQKNQKKPAGLVVGPALANANGNVQGGTGETPIRFQDLPLWLQEQVPASASRAVPPSGTLASPPQALSRSAEAMPINRTMSTGGIHDAGYDLEENGPVQQHAPRRNQTGDLAFPYNLPQHGPIRSPRTTRHNMLKSEFTESVRTNVLWIRTQARKDVYGPRRRSSGALSQFQPMTAMNADQYSGNGHVNGNGNGHVNGYGHGPLPEPSNPIDRPAVKLTLRKDTDPLPSPWVPDHLLLPSTRPPSRTGSRRGSSTNLADAEKIDEATAGLVTAVRKSALSRNKSWAYDNKYHAPW